MSLQVPVCFCIFNRPDTTERVFAQIRNARPSRLLVVGDGPRADRPGEHELVEQCRQLIRVDWPCHVETLFAESNLGCARRMASGLTWAFGRSERLIILEDDCLPDPTFFRFCEGLLERYAGQSEVMMISGDNFRRLDDWPASYYFSRWGHIWGWASWRRAWDHYRLDIPDWPGFRDGGGLDRLLGDRRQSEYWTSVMDTVHRGRIDTWDYSWQLAIFRAGGLVALPNENLVSNIGHDPRATHTTDANCRFARLPVRPLESIVHPTRIERHEAADSWTFENLFRPAPVAPLPESRRKRWWHRHRVRLRGIG